MKFNTSKHHRYSNKRTILITQVFPQTRYNNTILTLITSQLITKSKSKTNLNQQQQKELKPNIQMKILILICMIYLITPLTPTCDPASTPTPTGVCVKPTYIQGCHTYASSTKCHECGYGYIADDYGKCQYQQQNTKPCCKAHNLETGVCETCEVGLFLESGKCVSKQVLGCLNQDEKGNCINCAKQYFLQNGLCKEGILNCATYVTLDASVICDQCQSGHSLINNACLPNSILGCKDQVDGVCKDCYDPFIQKDNHCQVPNCQSHNEFGCVTCQCGYYLTSQRKCQQISQGCIRYNRGVCTDCMQHFQLKGGVCDIEGCLKIDGIRCTECQEEYESTELGCKLKHCMIAKEGSCEVCDQGYHYREGGCVAAGKVVTIV